MSELKFDISNKGKIQYYYFENLKAGLKKDIYNIVSIPVDFYKEEKIFKTELVIDWIKLNERINNIDSFNISNIHSDFLESSMYVDGIHQDIELNEINLEIIENEYYVSFSGNIIYLGDNSVTENINISSSDIKVINSGERINSHESTERKNIFSYLKSFFRQLKHSL